MTPSIEVTKKLAEAFVTDVAAYVRKLREPRYRRDGSRNEP